MDLTPKPVLSLSIQPWAERSVLWTLPVSPGSRPWDLLLCPTGGPHGQPLPGPLSCGALNVLD